MNKITENVYGEVEAVKSNEKFVRVPMKMFAYTSKGYATDDEIAVYYEIAYHASARDVSISHVNIDLLYARLQWDASTQSRGKKRIIKAIEGLKEKGYISIDNYGDEIKATTYLTIHTPRNMSKLFNEKITSERTVFTGWTAITESVMNIAKTDVSKIGQRLKVLTYVLWRHNINYAVCFEEWANVLQVSSPTAKRIIKSLNEEGIIDVTSGVYYTDVNGNVRQEINQYSINNEPEEDDVDGYKPTFKQRFNQFIKIDELLELTTDRRMDDRTELFIYGSQLSDEDMYIYLTTDCSYVKEWGKKRFDSIGKTCKSMVEDWEAKARKRIKQEQDEPKIVDAYSDSDAKENKTTVDINISIINEDENEQLVRERRKKQQLLREEQERIRKEKESEDFWSDDTDDEQEESEVHIAFMKSLKEKREQKERLYA